MAVPTLYRVVVILGANPPPQIITKVGSKLHELNFCDMRKDANGRIEYGTKL